MNSNIVIVFRFILYDDRLSILICSVGGEEKLLFAAKKRNVKT